MTRRNCLALTFVVVWMAAYGETQNKYYAGPDNPLVSLGAQRVFKNINYPEWFQYPAMPKDVRQQLVDLYSTRDFLASMDSSSANYQRYMDAAQLIADLLGTSRLAAGDGSMLDAPAKKEINNTLRSQVVPQLVKPREGNEQDSPSARESDYGSPNGYDIWRIDLKLKVLVHDYKIPTGYRPPSSFMTPTEREASQRNQDKIARETLAPAKTAAPKTDRYVNCDYERYVAEDCAKCAAARAKGIKLFSCDDGPERCQKAASTRHESCFVGLPPSSHLP